LRNIRPREELVLPASIGTALPHLEQRGLPLGITRLQAGDH